MNSTGSPVPSASTSHCLTPVRKLLLTLGSFMMFAPHAQADCGSGQCGSGDSFTVEFQGAGTIFVVPTGTVVAKMTIFGENDSATTDDRRVSSPDPGVQGVAAVVTVPGEIVIKPNKIYKSTLESTYTVGLVGACESVLSGRFTPKDACGWVMQLSYRQGSAPFSEWKDAENVTYSLVAFYSKLDIQLRLVKPEGQQNQQEEDGGAGEEPESGGSSGPAIPPDKQDVPPGTNGLPVEVTPPTFYSTIPLGVTPQSGRFGTGDLSLVGIISPTLADPANLKVRDPNANVLKIVPTTGTIEQVTNLTRLANVSTVVGGGFEVKFYESGSFSTTVDGTGHYPLNPGAVASETVRYTPLAAASDHQGGIRVTTIGLDGGTHVRDTLSTSATGESWRTVEGNEVTNHLSVFLYDNAQWQRTDQTTVTRDGVLVSKNQQVYLYQVRRDPLTAAVNYSGTFKLEESVYDTATTALVTSWEPDAVFPGRVKSVTRPDGSWEAYTYYTGSESGADLSWRGLLKQTLQSWGDSPASPALATPSNSESTLCLYSAANITPGSGPGTQLVRQKTTAPVSGTPVIRDWERTAGLGTTSSLITLLTNAGLHADWTPTVASIREEGSATYATATEKLVTTSFTYLTAKVAEGSWGGSTFATLDEEGNGSVTGYELGTYNAGTGVFTANPAGSTTGTFVRSLTVKVADFGSPVGFQATRSIEIRDRQGKPLRREFWVKDASAWNKATTTTYEYPALWPDGSAKQTIEKLDGRVISQVTQVSAHETVHSDEQGITTTTITDDQGRIVTSTKAGVAATYTNEAQPAVVTSYSYSEAGTRTTISAGGLSHTRISRSDLTGRTISETDLGGAITTTAYPNGGRDTLVTLPGGVTRLTTRRLDGRTASVTGSGVIRQIHEYDALSTGNLTSTVRRGGTSGTSPRYSTTETDLGGRTVKTTTPSPAAGGGTVLTTATYRTGTRAIASQTTPFGTQLTAHPTTGSTLAYSGYDVNGGGLAPASTDRITETSTAYSLETGAWYQLATRKQYDAASPSTTAITSRVFQRLTSPQTIDYRENGEMVSSGAVIDRPTKTSTAYTRWSGASGAASGDQTETNVNGLTVSSTTRDGAATTFAHDALGRVIRQTSPRGAVSLTRYGATGEVTATVDAYGQATRYEYYGPTHASAGRVSIITRPDGTTTRYTYDLLGNTTETAGTAEYRVTSEYDDYGQLKKQSTWRTPGTADTTEWVYQDATGALEKKIHPDAKETAYTYHASGKVATRTWKRGVATTYAYNGYGDLTGIDYSDSTPDVTLSAYDRVGRPTSITQTGLGTENLSYHAGLRLMNARYYTTGHTALPGLGMRLAAPVYGWPGGFVETSASNATAVRTVAYSYYQARLDIIDDGGQKQFYSYYPNSGEVSTLESGTGSRSGATRTVAPWFKDTWSLDSSGRLISIKSDRMTNSTTVAGRIATHSYDYDAVGRRTKVTQQDGTRWEYGYNNRSEVTAAVRKDTAGTAIPELGATYAYDGIGNRTASTSPVLGDHTYTPNSLNQYATVTTGSSRTAIGRAPTTWSVEVYPTGGTVTTASRNGELYYRSLTAANTSAPVWQSVISRRSIGTPTTTRGLWYAQASVTPVYDLDGNLTNDGRWSYTWDAENRLIQMETTVAATTANHPYTKLVFKYDWEGRRIERVIWKGTATTPVFSSCRRWVYDGWNPIVEYSATSATSTTNTRLSNYTWGKDLSGSLQGAGGVGGLIIQNTVATGAINRASYDGNGNIVAWTRSNVSTPDYRREYDAFGNTLVSEGTSPSEFGFSTKIQDPGTGLYYYGHRYYDPVHGRWLNRDPIGEEGSINMYSMVKNNPAGSVDILGLVTYVPNGMSYDPLGGQKITIQAKDLGLVYADDKERQKLFDLAKKLDVCCLKEGEMRGAGKTSVLLIASDRRFLVGHISGEITGRFIRQSTGWRFSGELDPEDNNYFDFGPKPHHGAGMNALLSILSLGNAYVGNDIIISGEIPWSEIGNCESK